MPLRCRSRDMPTNETTSIRLELKPCTNTAVGQAVSAGPSGTWMVERSASPLCVKSWLVITGASGFGSGRCAVRVGAGDHGDVLQLSRGAQARYPEHADGRGDHGEREDQA